MILGILEVRAETEIFLDVFLDTLAAFDLAQFIDRLGIIRDRAIAVHRDGHRSHAEETEGNEAERKDRRGETELRRHERDQSRVLREVIGDEHEDHDDQTHPEC